jgi:hypothetical protein
VLVLQTEKVPHEPPEKGGKMGIPRGGGKRERKRKPQAPKGQRRYQNMRAFLKIQNQFFL